MQVRGVLASLLVAALSSLLSVRPRLSALSDTNPHCENDSFRGTQAFCGFGRRFCCGGGSLAMNLEEGA
eukprot:1923140-Rhodomonas_salina.1